MYRWLVGLGVALALACAGPEPVATAPDAGTCHPSDVKLMVGGQTFEGVPALAAAARAGQVAGDPPLGGFERVEFDEGTPLPCALDLGPLQMFNVVDYFGLSASGELLVVVDGTSSMRSLRAYSLPGLEQRYSAGLQDAKTVQRDGKGFRFVAVTDKKVPCADPALEAGGMSCYELREMKLGEGGKVREGEVRGVAATE
jgi:hypothetical protein